jgi:HEAT repeat protein
LSLLQQQSASDRLRGVSWSYRVEQSDTEVLSALLHTVNQDSNVSVRLAAVDALRNFGDSPVARKGITQSLLKQTSPMVQIALVDVLVELRERPAVPTLKLLLATPDLDKSVKSKIESAIAQLG